MYINKKKELQIYEGHTPRKMINYIAKKSQELLAATRQRKKK
jgi:hypothetical protein